MQRRGFWRYENGVLIMLVLTFALVFFDRLSLMYLLPFVVKDIPLTDTQVGLLSSALALTWAVSGYLVGRHSDRSGRRKALLIFTVIGFSLCTVLTGLASTFALLLVIRAIMGAFEGPVLPITQAIMAEESSEHRRGFNMGMVQTAGPPLLASVIGPPLVVALGNWLGWRVSMYVVGVPGLIMAAVLWRFLRDRKPSREAAADSVARNGSVGVPGLLSYRNIWLCLLIACGLNACVMNLLTYTPLYTVRTRGFSPEQMGLLMSMIGLAAFAWGSIVPLLSDRFGRKPVMVVFALVMSAAPLIIVHHAGSPTSVAVLFALTFTGVGCIPLAMATVPSETVPPRVIASAVGLLMGMAEIVGGVIAVVLSGIASDHLGASMPYYVATGGALLAALSSLFLIETAPRKRMSTLAVDGPTSAR